MLRAIPKTPADSRLAGPAIESRNDRLQFLRRNGCGAAATPAAPTRCRKSGLNPFVDQGTFELRQRAEDMEKKLALGVLVSIARSANGRRRRAS